jgi:Nucleotidyltransferase
VGGISSQNLRYVEVLLAGPWSVTLSASNGFPLADDTRVQIANPVSFLVQKILIHGRRNRDDERAKDILYIHDTIEAFVRRIDELRAEWATNTRPVLHVNSVRTIQRAAASLFGAVTDPIRTASRIICLQRRFERPVVWDLRGFSEKESVKNKGKGLYSRISTLPGVRI